MPTLAKSFFWLAVVSALGRAADSLAVADDQVAQLAFEIEIVEHAVGEVRPRQHSNFTLMPVLVVKSLLSSTSALTEGRQLAKNLGPKSDLFSSEIARPMRSHTPCGYTPDPLQELAGFAVSGQLLKNASGLNAGTGEGFEVALVAGNDEPRATGLGGGSRERVFDVR